MNQEIELLHRRSHSQQAGPKILCSQPTSNDPEYLINQTSTIKMSYITKKIVSVTFVHEYVVESKVGVPPL